MPTQTTPAPAATSAELRATISFIDCLSQGAFSEIKAIAKLALAQLEHPDGYNHPDVIARALSAIFSKAEDVENTINSEAELVGCNHVDEAQLRRWAAWNSASHQRRGVAA